MEQGQGSYLARFWCLAHCMWTKSWNGLALLASGAALFAQALSHTVWVAFI